jgi:hypothetical protein
MFYYFMFDSANYANIFEFIENESSKYRFKKNKYLIFFLQDGMYIFIVSLAPWHQVFKNYCFTFNFYAQKKECP